MRCSSFSTKQTGPFTDEDVRLVQPAAELGTELLRQALGQKQMHRLLFDAVAAALGASATLWIPCPARPPSG